MVTGPLVGPCANDGRATVTGVEWTEEVQKAAVVLFDFQLTRTGKLRSATVRELKRVYGLGERSEDEENQ